MNNTGKYIFVSFAMLYGIGKTSLWLYGVGNNIGLIIGIFFIITAIITIKLAK